MSSTQLDADEVVESVEDLLGEDARFVLVYQRNDTPDETVKLFTNVTAEGARDALVKIGRAIEAERSGGHQ